MHTHIVFFFFFFFLFFVFVFFFVDNVFAFFFFTELSVCICQNRHAPAMHYTAKHFLKYLRYQIFLQFDENDILAQLILAFIKNHNRREKRKFDVNL